MSIFEQVIKVIAKDLAAEAGAIANRIVNANLPHVEYSAAQTSFRVVSNIQKFIEGALHKVNSNPDAPVPETFVEANSGESDPEEKEPESTIHTVDVETGTVSSGSN